MYCAWNVGLIAVFVSEFVSFALLLTVLITLLLLLMNSTRVSLPRLVDLDWTVHLKRTSSQVDMI